MKLLTFKSLWDINTFSSSYLKKVKEARYDGVEYVPPKDKSSVSEFLGQLEDLELKFIAQVVTRGEDHLTSFREQVYRAAELNPVSITAHSARDSMSLEQQIEFFHSALLIEKEVGVPVMHETHRGRAFFTPWSTASVLQCLPDLKLCADLSHWSVVCESLPDLNDENVALCMKHVSHIHGRVGWDQSAQVSDPKAPEYSSITEHFIQLWLKICEHHKSKNESSISFTPEFGPFPYMPCQVYTQQPLVDIWDVNLWMRDQFSMRFKKQFL